MKLVLRILIFASAIYAGYALCNACSLATGLACVANNQFKVCVNGLPTGAATQCPTGYVCSDTAPICSLAGSVPPSCGNCGRCNDARTFACTGYNTFSLCFGTTVPTSANITCPNSLVCNMDAANACIDPLTTGIGGTCPSVATSPTTPDPGADPQGYCASVARAGRYEITTDSTCQGYVLCALVNSTWVGRAYQCPGSTFFNSSSAMCGVERPSRCPLT